MLERGIVTRTDASGVYVTLGRLYPGSELGPLATVVAVTAGDTVLAGQVGMDDWTVVGTLTPTGHTEPAWASHDSPTWAGTGWAAGSSTVSWRYVVSGDTVHYALRVTFDGQTNGSGGLTLSLPAGHTAASHVTNYWGFGRMLTGDQFLSASRVGAGKTTMQLYTLETNSGQAQWKTFTSTSAGAPTSAGHYFEATGTYELA